MGNFCSPPVKKATACHSPVYNNSWRTHAPRVIKGTEVVNPSTLLSAAPW